MGKVKQTRTAALALLILLSAPFAIPEYARAENRIALVLGNGAYGVGRLSDPPNDVQLVSNTLRSLGFDVTQKINLSQQDMKILIRDFGNRLKAHKDSIGLFYYSGHGMRVGGNNYMIPIRVNIKDESDVEIFGVNINDVLTRMRFAGNFMNLVFLDACRDNPFEKSFKSTVKGLGRMDSPKGTLIAYAAQPNKVALQGPGKYSYFTEALAREMVKPGISATEMLRNVRNTVYEMTESKQLPVVEDMTLAKFFFSREQPVTSEQTEKKSKIRGPFEKDVVAIDSNYVAYNNGIVKDMNTGLEWVVSPDKNTSYDEAKSWAKSLTIDGGGWLIPTFKQLATLFKRGLGEYNMTPLLKAKGTWVWHERTKTDHLSRWFSFWDGTSQSYGHGDRQAFAVRRRSDG